MAVALVRADEATSAVEPMIVFLVPVELVLAA